MKITILTLFPNFFDEFKNTSIIKRCIDKGIVEIEAVNFRDFSKDRLKRVDDAPIGGGAGMIIGIEPLIACLNAYRKENSKVYLLSASGKVFKQQSAKEMASIEHLILICGHYEGVDARLLDYIDGEICIGDYILTGGEIAAMAMSDCIIRLLSGAINAQSVEDESFTTSLLEYPQYTSPRIFDNKEVPSILYSGNHKEIKMWRLKQSILKTISNRPDLFDINKLTKDEMIAYKSIENDENEQKAIEKAHKFMKKSN